MPDGEWKKLGERSYKGAYKTFLVKTYQTPDGSTHDFDIWFTPNGFVSAFALTKNKEVIVARQFRPGPEKKLYEMPAGVVDEGESRDDAMQRELREETGYQAGSLVPLLKDAAFMPYAQSYGNYYIALDCERVHETQFDDGEYVEVELMPIKDYVNKALRKGMVSHADGAWLAIDYLVRTNQLRYSDIM